VRVQLPMAIVAVAMGAGIGLGSAWGQDQPPSQPASQQASQPASEPASQQASQPASQPAPKQPQWKDRAEYDLVESIRKETDPHKKLDLLNQWKQKYPNTDFKVLRLETYVDIYRQLNDPANMLASAKELLSDDPKNLTGAYWISLLVVSSNNPTPDNLALATKAAQNLLAAEKPAATSEEQWQKTKPQMEAIAHRTLGWVAMQNKQYTDAQNEFTAELKANPGDSEAVYWLASVLRSRAEAEKKPELFAQALYLFARSASYDGTGAFDPTRRKQVEAWLQKAYTTYHGQDAAGFQQLLATAKTSVFPPADFKIMSAEEIAVQKEAELRLKNPSLAFWLNLKAALSAATGMQYYESGVKNALIPPEGQPPLGGTVISGRPEVRPTTLVLGIAKPDVPEVTLKLDAPLPGKVEPGREIQFRGVAAGFTQTPFMMTFDVEKKDLTGWPAPPPPPKRSTRKR
jgi:hypothetical protein